MTNADLKQIYYICKEIKLCEAELRELKHSSLTGSRIDGMPKSGRGDKVADRAIRIADLEAKIERLQDKMLDAQLEIWDFIDTIDDSMIRQIIIYKHIKLMSWTKTAHKIGGGNTADSCRMAYKRFMRIKEGTNGGNSKAETQISRI